MGALAPVTPWIPEDDFLLKNAVEEGASLESLAKGAIHFSRKFSVRELRERWHALLYDPVISEQAALSMVELEHSASTTPSKLTKAGNSKGNRFKSGKRKYESVRNCYYALRKRICNEPFNSMDPSFLVGPSNGDCVGNGNGPSSGHLMVGDPTPLYFSHPERNLDVPSASRQTLDEGINVHEKLLLNTDQAHGCPKFDQDQGFGLHIPQCGQLLPNTEFSSPLPGMPMWKKIEGISEPGIDDLGIREQDPHAVGIFPFSGDSNLLLEMPSEDLKNAPASAEGYLAELSNSLLNFTNDDELLFMDVEGKDVFDKSYYDGLSSLLLNSPSDMNHEHMLDVTGLEPSVNPDNVTNHLAFYPGKLHEDNLSNHLGSVVSDSSFQVLLSASAPDPRFPELVDGIICCVLNSEDTEIPNNDHVRPKPISSATRQTHGLSHASHYLAKLHVLPDTNIDSQVGLHSGDSSHRTAAVAYAEVDQINSAKYSPEVLAPKPMSENSEATLLKNLNCISFQPSTERPTLGSDGYHHHSQMNASGSELELGSVPRFGNPVASNSKAWPPDVCSSGQFENLVLDAEEELSESDDDVPCFSDVESMILDMDLEPEDWDPYLSEEVSKYLSDQGKRTFMRLEQAAGAFTQRCLAFHGALAVLIGRHSKHYIKKPEVLLGRGTNDSNIDIDLKKEGPATKISRQQAIIYLDRTGSFHLKNLGKVPMYVNDWEVAPGQSQHLTPSCLIVVREIWMMFGINKKLVKLYLDSINPRNGFGIPKVEV